MKDAIVHDWLTNYGGAERVLKKISELFPTAPIYTIVYNKERMGGIFSDVRPSFIQHMPFGVKKYTAYLPFMPKAVERFDLSEYDLVISSSTCCAKGVLTRADTLHICYCATPMRYAWDFYFDYLKSAGGFKRKLIPHFMHHIRMWDALTANRVDQFLANSKNVQKGYPSITGATAGWCTRLRIRSFSSPPIVRTRAIIWWSPVWWSIRGLILPCRRFMRWDGDLW